MKKALFLLIALMVAIPAFAQSPAATTSQSVQDTIHLGSLDLSTGEFTSADEASGITARAPGDIVWDNSAGIPSFFNFANFSLTGTTYVDPGDLPEGTVIGGFQIGFATDAVGDITLRYTFSEGEIFDAAGAPLTTASGGQAIYDIDISGLPGGGIFGFTLDITGIDPFIISGADLDMDGNSDWIWGIEALDAGNATALGPSLAGEGPFLAPGRFDAFDVYVGGVFNSSLFFGGNPFAQYHMQLVEGRLPVINVPTASHYGLLALFLALAGAAFVVIRRR